MLLGWLALLLHKRPRHRAAADAFTRPLNRRALLLGGGKPLRRENLRIISGICSQGAEQQCIEAW
jgi:hypothetical protein